MERMLLTRVGHRWYAGGLPVRNNVRCEIGDGWAYAVRSHRRSFTVEVSQSEITAYHCALPGQRVWLFPQGVVELSHEDNAHWQLAHTVLEALAQRAAGTVFARIQVLPHGKTLKDTTFRTRHGANNYFSDGSLQPLSSIHERVVMRCVGGTYLLRTMRREDHTVFGVEITAHLNCHAESLARRLRQLA